MAVIEEQTFWNANLTEETRLWMRYLSLRPWFQDHSVVDFGASSTFGIRYASFLAETATLISDSEKVGDLESSDRFGFVLAPDSAPIPQADVLLCFEALNASPIPEQFLSNLSSFGGLIAIGCQSDNDWTIDSFKRAIASNFSGKTIRYLAQSESFPHRLSETDFDGSTWWVALINESTPFVWPKLGFAMPTVDSPNEVREAIFSLTRTYPGEIQFAVVANGSTPETLSHLHETANGLPEASVSILATDYNLGFGQGCNKGLEFLQKTGEFDYYGVINDDVLPDIDCLCELVSSMIGLEGLGLKPGLIGPVSNYINGAQQVEFGTPTSYSEMLAMASNYRFSKASSVKQVRQLRGLCFLMPSQLLSDIGGFDPIFGIGNFEDDDFNLRTHLSGYSIWIAEGSFLYHIGSNTFRKLKIDYTANIARNAEALSSKWSLSSAEDWPSLCTAPKGTSLHVPLSSWKETDSTIPITINGEQVDLIHQASDLEFAAWVMGALKNKPRSERLSVIRLLEPAA
jgi:GT2 family glycosyltransferase